MVYVKPFSPAPDGFTLIKFTISLPSFARVNSSTLPMRKRVNLSFASNFL